MAGLEGALGFQRELFRVAYRISIQTQCPETFVTSAAKVLVPGIDDLLLACLDLALCFLDPR